MLSFSGMRRLCRSTKNAASSARIPYIKKIHTQGNGLFGALGQGPGLMDSEDFETVNLSDESRPNGRKVHAKQVSAGWGHSGAVTIDGELMIWGRRNDFANLNTLLRIKGIFSPLARACCRLGSIENEVHTAPKIVDGLDKVSSVHCSAGLTVALTDSGDLYSFGQNSWGQCGTGVISDMVYLTPQEVAINPKVKAVDVGLQHCIAVSRCGYNVFTWGKGLRGQLGIPIGTEERFAVPQLVGGLNGIVVGVSAGLNHSAAVTSSGAVYLWGKGMSELENIENKRARYVDVITYKDQFAPRLVHIPGDRKALEISSSNHTLAIRCDDDSLWALGAGEYDKKTTMNLMQVQQECAELLEYAKPGQLIFSSPFAVLPSGCTLRKGYTRVGIISPSSSGMTTAIPTPDTPEPLSVLYEIILEAGEAYLAEKKLTFPVASGVVHQGKRVLDYSSGWTHNILVLAEKE